MKTKLSKYFKDYVPDYTNLEKQEIIEGHDLIIKFLEWEKGPNHTDENPHYLVAVSKTEMALDYMPFHASWDWVMYVVEDIFATTHQRDLQGGPEWGRLWDQIEDAILINFDEQETYQACIRMILWVNDEIKLINERFYD